MGLAGTGYAVGETITVTQTQINSIGAWGAGASTAGDLVITLDSNMVVGGIDNNFTNCSFSQSRL